MFASVGFLRIDVRWSLSRRPIVPRARLCLGLSLSLSFGVVFQNSFSLERAQLNAVLKQVANQAALRINGSRLFHHQRGQQTVRDQK